MRSGVLLYVLPLTFIWDILEKWIAWIDNGFNTIPVFLYIFTFLKKSNLLLTISEQIVYLNVFIAAFLVIE